MSSFNLGLSLEMAAQECRLFSDLLHALQNLTTSSDNSETLLLKQLHLADLIFFAIFDLEIEEVLVTEEQKDKLGPLIHQSLPYLEACIDNEALNFPTSSFESACYLRSGLQFLLDNYSNYFPEEELERAGERISSFRESLDLDDLDRSLREYTHREFDPHYDVSETTTKLEDMGLIDQHFWWQ